jgi:hypothetical protein
VSGVKEEEMITELTDDLLADYSDGEIAEYIRERFKGDVPASAAVALYISALRMKPDAREDVFSLFRSAPLLCRECGRPSCIHGYSDE